MAEGNSNDLKWELLISDCWDDEALKKRLLKDPAAVCKERGIEIPAGVKLNVVENTDAVVNIVIPAPPKEEELSEEQLETVAGGHTSLCFSLCVGGCRSCSGCSGCSGCRSCSGCGGCSGCSGCRSCSGCGGCGGCRP